MLTGTANNNQQPPTITGTSSSAGQTIIGGTVSGFAANTSYIIEFFASSPTDPFTPGQAHVFLGRTTVTTNGTGSASFSVTLAVSVGAGQSITATATSSATAAQPNDTSELSAPLGTSSAFIVTTTADNGNNQDPILGSLRQLIVSLNAASPGNNRITFKIPTTDPGYNAATGTWTIQVEGSPLPALIRPVVLDGTSQPGYAGTPVVEIDANGTSAGLTLNSGSDGSAIEGLSIVGSRRAGNCPQLRVRPGHRGLPGAESGGDGRPRQPDRRGDQRVERHDRRHRCRSRRHNRI